MVLLQRKLYFSSPTFSRGGTTFSGGGGVQMLISIETLITCDFPGGSGPHIPLSGSAQDSHNSHAIESRPCGTIYKPFGQSIRVTSRFAPRPVRPWSFRPWSFRPKFNA